MVMVVIYIYIYIYIDLPKVIFLVIDSKFASPVSANVRAKGSNYISEPDHTEKKDEEIIIYTLLICSLVG